MAEYSTEIPKVITAGNTVEFAMRAYDSIGTELTSGNSWTMYWTLSNSTANYTVSSQTENDQGFFFQVPHATTSGWTAGDYSSSVYADDATNRYPQDQEAVTVKPSLDSAVDGRSTYRQIADAIDAAILGSAGSNQLSMSIAGRTIQRMGMEELMKAKTQFDSLVKSEENAKQMLDGKITSNTIYTRIV